MATPITGIALNVDFTGNLRLVVFCPYLGPGVNLEATIKRNVVSIGTHYINGQIYFYDNTLAAYVVWLDTPNNPWSIVGGTQSVPEIDNGSITCNVVGSPSETYSVRYSYKSYGYVVGGTKPQGIGVTYQPCSNGQSRVIINSEAKPNDHYNIARVEAQKAQIVSPTIGTELSPTYLAVTTYHDLSSTGDWVQSNRLQLENFYNTKNAIWDLGLINTSEPITVRVIGYGTDGSNGYATGDFIEETINLFCSINGTNGTGTSGIQGYTSDYVLPASSTSTGCNATGLKVFSVPTGSTIKVNSISYAVGSTIPVAQLTISGGYVTNIKEETTGTTPIGTLGAKFLWTSLCGESQVVSVNRSVSTGCVPPSITTQPISNSNCTGNPINISVVVSSTTTPSYQWYKNTVLIVGANSSSYSATTSGNYHCIITNGCGSITSDTVFLNIGGEPVITTQLLSYTGCASPRTLFVVATGATSYYWYKNDEPVAGPIGPNYNVTTSGDYYVVAVNDCGGTYSNTVSVVITPSPVVNSDPNPYTGCNTSELLQVLATNATSYQWQKNLVDIVGATSSTYLATSSGSYRVRVSNVCGSVYSYPAAVSFVVAPVLSGLTIPNAIANVPYSATINVESGSTPLSITGVTKPSWMTISLSGNTISFSGLPTSADIGVLVAFSLDNLCGTAAFNQNIDVQPGCINVDGGTIIGPTKVIAGNEYTYQLVGLTGTAPFAYSVSVTGGTIISGHGTDTVVVTRTANGAVVFSVTNCSSGGITRSTGVALITANAVDDSVVTMVNTPASFNLSTNDITCN